VSVPLAGRPAAWPLSAASPHVWRVPGYLCPFDTIVERRSAQRRPGLGEARRGMRQEAPSTMVQRHSTILSIHDTHAHCSPSKTWGERLGPTRPLTRCPLPGLEGCPEVLSPQCRNARPTQPVRSCRIVWHRFCYAGARARRRARPAGTARGPERNGDQRRRTGTGG